VVSALAGITSYHSTSSSLVTYETEPWHPFWYVWNNIVEQGRNSDGYNDINVLFARSDHDLDMDTVHIDGNYFYPRSPTDPVINVIGQHNDFSVTEYMENGWAERLYANTEDATDPLHEAGQPYKTRTGHVLTGSTTLSTGGTGGDHPYLDGVSIPSYVGPCADAPCEWMDEVEALRDVANLYE